MSDVAELTAILRTEGAAQATREIEQMSFAGKQAETSTLDLTDALHTLGEAFALKEIVDFTVNLAKLGARYEMLGATLGIMANNAGFTRAQMEGFQEGMEKTGISAIKARQGLQIMAAAQLDLSKATALGRVAQDAATLAGINSSEAYAKLVQGISTGESRIIRHMGIMVNFKKAIDDEAHSRGIQVSSLDAEALAQIRLQATLAEGIKRQGVYEEAMTTAGKQMLSMERYTENLRVQIGELFNPSTNVLMFAMVAAVREASEAMKEWQASGDATIFAAGLKAKMEDLVGTIKATVHFIYEWRSAIETLGAAYAGFKLTQFVNVQLESLNSVRAALTRNMQAEVQAAAVRVAIMQKKLADALVDKEVEMEKQAMMPVKFRSEAEYQALRVRGVMLDSEAAVAKRGLAMAEEQLAAAQLAQAGAQSLAQTALGAVGGPIGILIISLSVLAAWWWKVSEAERDYRNGVKATVDATQEAAINIGRIAAAKEKKDKGGTAAEIEAILHPVTETPAGQAARKTLEMAAENYKREYAAANSSKGSTAGAAADQAARDKATAKYQEAKDTYDRFVRFAEENQRDTLAKEKADLDARKLLHEPIPVEAKVREDSEKVNRQMASMEEKIANYKLQGLNYTKEEIEEKKAQNAYDKQMDDWNFQTTHMVGGKDDKHPELSKEDFDKLSSKAREMEKARKDAVDLHHQEEEAHRIADKNLRDNIKLMADAAKIRADYAAAIEKAISNELDAARASEKENSAIAFSMDVLSKAYQDGEISAQQYTQRIFELQTQVHRTVPVFGDLRDTINNSMTSSAKALQDFCNTGKFAFKDLILSMLKDMQMLAIKNSVISPLFAALTGSLTPKISVGGGGGVGLGPTAAGTTPYVQSNYAAAPVAAASLQSVAVTIHNNGAVTSDIQSSDGAAQMGTVIHAAVQKSIITEQRPGGLLYQG